MDRGKKREEEGHSGRGHSMSKGSEKGKWEAGITNSIQVQVRFKWNLKVLHSVVGTWASLVAQCLRIRLPMQGTWVRALVQGSGPHAAGQLGP